MGRWLILAGGLHPTPVALGRCWVRRCSSHPVLGGISGHCGVMRCTRANAVSAPHQGNIRVFGRVRPITKEDGEGPEAANAVTFDANDDAVLHLLHKGKQVSFELDKVFPPQASQEEVGAVTSAPTCCCQRQL